MTTAWTKTVLLAGILAAMTTLSACSTTGGSEGEAGDTDLQPLEQQMGQAGSGGMAGEDVDLGVEIHGIEIGNGVADGSALGQDAQDAQGAMSFQPVVYFGFDQALLSDENTALVKHYAQVLVDNPEKTVKLQGHTDERGSPEYNLALAEKRAKAVAQVMMLFGVNEGRIEVISFGEEQPAALEHNEEAWRLNRRVEIKIH